jgi:hypothetical protein
MAVGRADTSASDGLLAAALQALGDDGYRSHVDAVVCSARPRVIALLSKLGSDARAPAGARSATKATALSACCAGRSGRLASESPSAARPGKGAVARSDHARCRRRPGADRGRLPLRFGAGARRGPSRIELLLRSGTVRDGCRGFRNVRQSSRPNRGTIGPRDGPATDPHCDGRAAPWTQLRYWVGDRRAAVAAPSELLLRLFHRRPLAGW